MIVDDKVWEKQLAERGYDPASWLVYKEDWGSITRGARVLTYSKGFTRLSYAPPFLLDSGGKYSAMVSLFCLDVI
jgi:hypothetical protein